MAEKRFIRNINGQIYDNENNKFYEENYEGKPLEYEDDVILELNRLNEENKELKRELELFVKFFKNQKYTIDDFNKWLVEEEWGMCFETKKH